MVESSQATLREGGSSDEWQTDALFLLAGLVMLSLSNGPLDLDLLASFVAGSLLAELVAADDESETSGPTLPRWLRLRVLAVALVVLVVMIDLGLFFSMQTTGSLLVGLSLPALLRTVTGEVRSMA